jgi:hypothetical protein
VEWRWGNGPADSILQFEHDPSGESWGKVAAAHRACLVRQVRGLDDLGATQEHPHHVDHPLFPETIKIGY